MVINPLTGSDPPKGFKGRHPTTDWRSISVTTNTDNTDSVIETIISDPNQANEIIAWLGLADNDYLAARVLLRRGLLIQGAILVNSAIEKYLKTVHRIKKIKFDTRGERAHNLVNLYRRLKGKPILIKI